jgi:hypothetical protein
MGRPLKIAKAQAVLTITATGNGLGAAVTVSDNLTTSPTVGVAVGMPFVVASTVGGLVANTIYYINAITGNNTFTVSTTQLSVQPRVLATLTTTTSQSVKASVAVVDAYFNNPVGGVGFPTTNANTYSVVGGNTAIIGKQVLAQVAIGISGTGTIYTSSANANIFGVGTNFGTQLSAGSTLQIGVPQNNGTTSFITLGTVSGAVAGYANIELSNATATGNFLTSVGNAQTLYANQPVVLSANIGGLTAGTTYFVRTIANAAAFSVADYVGGANVALTNEDATSYALQDRVVLTGVASTTAKNAPFIYANDEAGYIVRQKGKQKYLVTGATSGLTAQCYTANLANTALTPNSMRILATYANAATQTVQSLSDHTGELFTATSGPIATGNIVFQNAAPVFATFNTAAVANAANGQPYAIVTIASA